MHDALLSEQIAYYRARASEYDEWFLRLGRYDMGAPENARWFAEVSHVKDALDAFNARGRVLELAGGTGFWTQHLVHHASELTVVDAAPENARDQSPARGRPARALRGRRPLQLAAGPGV